MYKNQQSRQTGSRNLTGPKMLPTIWHTYMKLVTKYQNPVINSCLEKCAYMYMYTLNVYKIKSQLSRQTGSRNLMGPKTLPTIWSTYMKLVTKYQIYDFNSCWEKCDEKCAYMFNVYKNQLSRQTGSRNLTGPKTLPTIWHTYTVIGISGGHAPFITFHLKMSHWNQKYLQRMLKNVPLKFWMSIENVPLLKF